MKGRGGARVGGGPRVIDASAGEPMAQGGRSPHSVLLAWLPRYVKQLLLIWSPQFQAFRGLVRRPVALARVPWCGRRGPRDGTRGGLGSAGGEGQARKELSSSPALQCFPARRVSWGGVGPARGRQHADVLPSLFYQAVGFGRLRRGTGLSGGQQGVPFAPGKPLKNYCKEKGEIPRTDWSWALAAARRLGRGRQPEPSASE